MSEVKRYDAVHLRYEENNIRYGEGCEVEVVTATDYAALEADYLRIISAQDDKWRAQHARDSAELRRLCAERDEYKRQTAFLRQHKNEYMDAAEVTRKALAAECERLRDALSKYADDNNWCYDTCDVSRDVAKAALSTKP